MVCRRAQRLNEDVAYLCLDKSRSIASFNGGEHRRARADQGGSRAAEPEWLHSQPAEHSEDQGLENWLLAVNRQ